MGGLCYMTGVKRGEALRSKMRRAAGIQTRSTKRASAQTSYQLTPQRQVLLPPAAEARQLPSGVVPGQRVPQSQSPQHQTLLSLPAELQLTQPGQTRLQALLGPTALHGRREGEGTLHPRPK